MAKAHAQTGDYVRKDGELVMVESVDRPNQTYYTSDGGCMGFDEVSADNVFLESEVYDQLPAHLLSANH
jgi:hypothetical protein